MNNTNFEFQIREERKKLFASFSSQAQSQHHSLSLCASWSQHADALIHKTFDYYIKDLPCALFVLGKLGSLELNLSSDIDLMIVAEEQSTELNSAVRKFSNALNENQSNGFVFRVDWDLRPGGKFSPLVPTLEQYKNHYEAYGETWERIALIRMRPLCGNKKLIEEILQFNQRFIFRKHLDYRVFDDLKLLRQRIHQQVLEKRQQASDINLKLDPGGIRDIELFAQSWVVIHGGRNPEVRLANTFEIYKKLSKDKLIPSTQAELLMKLYEDLRALENYVQSLNDQQTHLLTQSVLTTAPSWVRDLHQNLPRRLQESQLIVAELLGETSSIQDRDEVVSANDSFTDDDWQEVFDLKTHGLTLEQQHFLKTNLITSFVTEVKKNAGDQRLARGFLLDFLKSTRAKPSFFHLLIHNKNVLEQLAWMFGHSPYLSQILISRPELLDSFVFRTTLPDSPDWEVLLEQLVERKLLSEVINGVSFMRSRNLDHLVSACTQVADGIASSLQKKLNAELGTEVQVCALGKWGSQELGVKSDLDFILLCENEITEKEFKFARRFFSRLSEHHKGGTLYNIDLRLRPDGKSGPMISQLHDLQSFLEKEAPAWVRQAYLRLRLVGYRQLPQLETAIFAQEITQADLTELMRIQNELYKNARSPQDLKYSEGGILDIELFLQTHLLIHKTFLQKNANATKTTLMSLGFTELASCYEQLRCTEQLRLLSDQYSESDQVQIKKVLKVAQEELKKLDPRPRPS
ncbi:MAG: glutamine-synthetase adenylyltransferase [Bdellovibrionia bacterium]